VSPSSQPQTIHATAVLVGARALLIRGPAGSGKSRLAFQLVDAASTGRLPFARLVADDRVELEAVNGAVLARPPGALRGLLEIRSLGIRRMPYEPVAVVGRVLDLESSAAERLPDQAGNASLLGVEIALVLLPPGADALAAIIASMATRAA
jgi:HPr kinase/phosphorylase